MIHDNPPTGHPRRVVTINPVTYKRLVSFLRKNHTTIDGLFDQYSEDKIACVALAGKIKTIPDSVRRYYP